MDTIELRDLNSNSCFPNIDLTKLAKSHKETLFFSALEKCNLMAMQELIYAGVSLECRKDNNTPLSFAVQYSDFKTINFLLLNGANPDPDSFRGETLLALGLVRCDQDITCSLLSWMSDEKIRKYKESSAHCEIITQFEALRSAYREKLNSFFAPLFCSLTNLSMILKEVVGNIENRFELLVNKPNAINTTDQNFVDVIYKEFPCWYISVLKKESIQICHQIYQDSLKTKERMDNYLATQFDRLCDDFDKMQMDLQNSIPPVIFTPLAGNPNPNKRKANGQALEGERELKRNKINNDESDDVMMEEETPQKICRSPFYLSSNH